MVGTGMDGSEEKMVSKVEFISRQRLDRISLQAGQSPRLRKNYNFHASDDDICHRLLNAMEPESYIQPHMHSHATKDETLTVIRGRMGLVIFDANGGIQDKAVLEPDGEVTVVNIPHGIFHTWVSLQEGSVFFEAKAGPFVPITQEERAPWAPGEGDASAMPYLQSLKKLFVEP
jgi:cupin fold WbuC family metalloprotein